MEILKKLQSLEEDTVYDVRNHDQTAVSLKITDNLIQELGRGENEENLRKESHQEGNEKRTGNFPGVPGGYSSCLPGIKN